MRSHDGAWIEHCVRPIAPSIAATTSATEMRSRGARQAIAAGGAARAGDDAGMGQRLQHLGDGGARQARLGGQAARRHLPLGVGGKM